MTEAEYNKKVQKLKEAAKNEKSAFEKRIADMEAQLKSIQNDTKKINRKLATEDRKADKTI